MPNRHQNLLKLTSQAAATVNGEDQTNYNAKGIKLVIDITERTSTSTLTVTLEGKDPESGKYYTILASTALNAVGTTVQTVYPGMLAAANLKADDILPFQFRVKAVVASAGVISATIAASLIG